MLVLSGISYNNQLSSFCICCIILKTLATVCFLTCINHFYRYLFISGTVLSEVLSRYARFFILVQYINNNQFRCLLYTFKNEKLLMKYKEK